MPLDELREECGVFGVYAPGVDVARTTYFGLYALQHRGQESAGIATADGTDLRVHTRMGLVNTAFSEENLRDLTGHIAIGHTRYSTTGSSHPANAGPMVARSNFGTVAVAHNGNLVNSDILRRELQESGVEFSTTTDSEVLTWRIALNFGPDIVSRIKQAMSRFIGAYSLAVLIPDALIGVRAPVAEHVEPGMDVRVEDVAVLGQREREGERLWIARDRAALRQLIFPQDGFRHAPYEHQRTSCTGLLRKWPVSTGR
jgi:amidophosphoribosyltransferase